MTIFYNFSCNWNHFFGFLCIATEIIGKVFWNEIKFLCILSLQSSSTGPWYKSIEGQYKLQIYICLFWYLITIFRFISLFYNEKGQFLEFLQSVYSQAWSIKLLIFYAFMFYLYSVIFLNGGIWTWSVGRISIWFVLFSWHFYWAAFRREI